MPFRKLEKNHYSVRYYFVDEAGDGILFNRKGKVIVGMEGCSRYFFLGLMDISDHVALDADLSNLRNGLLKDSYFNGVPSMQLETGKTASAFHAKDDLPEIRREVFNSLMRHNLSFFAVVRDKLKVLEYVRQRNESDPTYRYNPNELYDYLVRRLFKDRLHQDDLYKIHFAQRGKSDRTEALKQALESAQKKFSEKWGETSNATFQVSPDPPKKTIGLQAVDYFLWALQRFYERKENRYLKFIWPSVKLIYDIDDTRQARYGAYYTQKKPLV